MDTGANVTRPASAPIGGRYFLRAVFLVFAGDFLATFFFVTLALAIVLTFQMSAHTETTMERRVLRSTNTSIINSVFVDSEGVAINSLIEVVPALPDRTRRSHTRGRRARDATPAARAQIHR